MSRRIKHVITLALALSALAAQSAAAANTATLIGTPTIAAGGQTADLTFSVQCGSAADPAWMSGLYLAVGQPPAAAEQGQLWAYGDTAVTCDGIARTVTVRVYVSPRHGARRLRSGSVVVYSNLNICDSRGCNDNKSAPVTAQAAGG